MSHLNTHEPPPHISARFITKARLRIRERLSPGISLPSAPMAPDELVHWLRSSRTSCGTEIRDFAAQTIEALRRCAHGIHESEEGEPCFYCGVAL